MLKSLYVKNLALIDEANVEFTEGLNVLTGETGAGKSILLGSVNLALGGKADKDMIRAGAEYALVEMTFLIDDKEKLERLKELDVLMENEGEVIVSRRIGAGRSVSRINGESVNSGMLKEITGILIDIHGQHEHQSLLYKSKHLEILDKYAKADIADCKESLKNAYEAYCAAEKSLGSFTMNEEQRLKERSFCQYEIHEIEEADLKPGEEEELEAVYRRYTNSQKIFAAMAAVSDSISGGQSEGALDKIGHAMKEAASVTAYDEQLSGIYSQLENLEALCGDLEHDVNDYLIQNEFDEEEFKRVESRLEQIRRLEGRYGRTIEDILEYLAKRREELAALEDYETRRARAEEERGTALAEAGRCADIVSEVRKKAARLLAEQIEAGLKELNFLEVHFAVEVRDTKVLTAEGRDEVEFMIAVNPGEALKPLGRIASGGELSRVMLAIKNVLSDKDEVDTLIFDEIDTGISGRTAQAVSKKLKSISRNRQVICITHLAQIAAPADSHFLIEKMVEAGRTVTKIHKLCEEEIIEELARILGGETVTDTVRKSAAEMKKMAVKTE